MSKADEFQIILLPEVEAAAANDPRLGEALREFSAAFRQALHAVETGQHETVDDALEAILGSRPMKIDPETGEPVNDGSTMQDDMDAGGVIGITQTGRDEE